MRGSKYAKKQAKRPKPQAVRTCPCGWKGQYGRRDMPDYCPSCGKYLQPKRKP